MVNYRDPKPTRASKKTISQFAENVARAIGFQAGTAIEPLVSNLRGSIAYRNAVGDKPESILVEPDGSFRIFLPTMTSMNRDKFTIAHELGHYYLHFPLIKHEFPLDGMRAYRWVDDANADLQRCEWEANWFAASFVMPSDEFKELFASGGISKVVNALGVSERAAKVRAETLGL